MCVLVVCCLFCCCLFSLLVHCSGVPRGCIQVTTACKKHGGFYLGSIGGPAAILAQNCIKRVEVLEYPELGLCDYILYIILYLLLISSGRSVLVKSLLIKFTVQFCNNISLLFLFHLFLCATIRDYLVIDLVN